MSQTPCVLASSSDGTTCLFDLANRTPLAVFKDCAASLKGLAVLGAPLAPGAPPTAAFFVAAQAGRPQVHVFSWGRDTPLFRCAVAEPLTSVAASRDGSLLAGGGGSGRAYVWDTATGELLRAWQAHYKAATALAFSPCGALLVSGGADGVVHCWDVAELCDESGGEGGEGGGGEGGSGSVAPHATWALHSQAVTAVAFSPGSGSIGGPGASRVVSCSLDRTVRWWDVASRTCLLCVTVPAGATAVCPDATGRSWLVGATDGVVYVLDAAPGTGGSAPVSGGAGNEVGAFVGHTAAVTCLCCSSEGGVLVSGSDDGSVRLWDVASRQQVAAWTAADAGSGAPAASTAGGASVRAPGGIMSLAILPTRPAALVVGGGKAPTLPLLPLAPLRKHATPAAGHGRHARVNVVRVSATLPYCGARDEDPRVALAAALHTLRAADAGAAAARAQGASLAAATEECDALRAQVAALTAENARWKVVAGKLANR